MKTFENDLKAFTEACLSNDVVTATQLLKIKEIAAVVDANDNALLKKMVEHGHAEIVTLLLTLENVKAFAEKNFELAFHLHINTGTPLAVALISSEFLNACMDNKSEVARTLSKNKIIIDAFAMNLQDVLTDVISISDYAEIVNILLEMDAAQENPQLDYDQLLKLAIDNNQVGIVKVLLGKHATFNIETDDHILKSFLAACRNNNVEMAKALAEQDTLNQHLDGRAGRMFLEEMVVAGHLEMVRLLLNKDKIQQNAHDLNNRVLTMAIEYGRAEIARTLLTLPKVKEVAHQKFGPAFESGAKNGLDEADVLILQKFQEACTFNNVTIASALLEQRAVKEYCAHLELPFLRKIVNRGYSKIISLLIQAGNFNEVAAANDNELLNQAIESDRPDIIKTLLNIEKVKALAFEKLGDKLEKRMKEGYSEIDALYLDVFEKACINNNMYLSKFLLKNPAVKKFSSNVDSAFLKRTIEQGHTKIIEFLADLSVNNADAILVSACENNNTNIVKFLLTLSSVKIRIAENNNQALNTAADNGNTEIVKLLLKVDSVKEKVVSTKAGQFPPNIVSTLYEADLPTMSGIIFTEETKDKKTEKQESLTANPHVVYNNEQYSTAALSGYPGTYQLGAPLYLDEAKTSSVGYNIHLPPQGIPIKNVIVEVYGGFQAKDKDSVMFRPGGLSDKDKQLLNNGTVVVKLNLPDLLKLNVYQSEMSEALHKEIHQAIDLFYQTLKNSPEKLDESLKNYHFNEVDIFLYGASFGGRTAVRHAELYPGTFSGYISHDGYLSFAMSQKADLIKRSQYASHLDPSLAAEIQKISEPILLLHNMDDNNVNAKVTLDFYQKLIDNGKADLARICITQTGNPISSSAANKGHFIPESQEDFIRYTKTLRDFMEKGPSSLPGITQWQRYHYNKLANKFYTSASLPQKFVAEILHRSRLDKEEYERLRQFGTDAADNIWTSHYKPLFYALHFTQKLTQDKSALAQEIARLQSGDLLTDEVVKKALRLQSNVFCQYLKEQYGISLSKEDIESQEMINMFKKQIATLATQKPGVEQFMLEALYQANPQLLASMQLEFEKDPQLEKSASLAKEKLNRTQSRERSMIRGIWQQAAKERLAITRLEKISSKIEAIKQQPLVDNKEIFAELIQLSKALHDENKLKKAIEQFDKLIEHFEKLNSKEEAVIINLICIKFAKSILTQDPAIEKTKDDAVKMLAQIKHPTEIKDSDHAACKKVIEDNFAHLNEDTRASSPLKAN